MNEEGRVTCQACRSLLSYNLIILTSFKALMYTKFCGLIHEHVENLMDSLFIVSSQREVMGINFKNLIQIEQLKSNNPSIKRVSVADPVGPWPPWPQFCTFHI